MIDDRLPDGTIFGSYKILGLIASGGMGQVYAARHQVFKHVVALKVLHASLHEDKDWRERFDWEGLVGLELKHPHVLSARERVHDGGRIALVLDLVPEGQTLEKLISREYPNGLDPDIAMDLFLKILGGLEYLHGKKPPIVHGDIKPENVMVKGVWRDPRTWLPMVTDFGTVALIANPVEIDGRPAVVATPRYASPEHLCGVDKIETRSDIYCLGLLLHYLLSGRHASNAQTVREAAERVQMPVPITYLTDVVPGELIGVFQRMVATDANARYDSVLSCALHVRAIRERDGATALPEYSDVDADLVTEQNERVTPQVIDRRSYSEMPTTNQSDSGSRRSAPSIAPASSGEVERREREKSPPVPISESARTGAPPSWPRPRSRAAKVVSWLVGLLLLVALIAGGRMLVTGG